MTGSRVEADRVAAALAEAGDPHVLVTSIDGQVCVYDPTGNAPRSGRAEFA